MNIPLKNFPPLTGARINFRDAADNSSALIYMIGSDGLCIWVNQGWLDFTGRAMEQELGMGWSDSIHTEDFQPCVDQYLKHFNAHESFLLEFRVRRADGEYHWVLDSGTPVFDSEGKFLGYNGVCFDIHGRKESDLALQESQERLFLAVQSNNIGVWDWNLQTEQMIWDDLMLELYKVKKSKTLTSGYLVDIWSKALHPKDRSRAQGELEAALNNKKPFDTEFRIIWPNGEVRHIKALAKVFFDDEGKPIRMLGTNVDITKSARVDQIKSEFISTAAHELRTPMTTIFGYAELLKDAPLDAEEQKEMITTIHRQSKSMVDLLNDILDIEKLESQATKLFSFRRQPIAPILEALASVFITNTNHNKVVLDITGNLPDLNIDRTKIEQAIRNLLSNAYKFSPNNDEINMQVSEVVHEGSSKVLIAIQDHGIGMTPEQLNRVYEKFYRADQSGLIPGTGLGMAITKDIITHHGGTIEIESKPGMGTKVMVYLPVA